MLSNVASKAASGLSSLSSAAILADPPLKGERSG
jgi:hypothetical protein